MPGTEAPEFRNLARVAHPLLAWLSRLLLVWLPRPLKANCPVVPPAGLEPATCGLKVRSSTN